MKDNAWNKYEGKKFDEVMQFSEGYKKFISDCKTERECVKEAIRMAKKNGYLDLKEVVKKQTKLKSGDKVYAAHMDKSIALFHLGSEDIEKGCNILGAHVDSPRLDLKQNPLYEDKDFAMLDTHYYGGIKKYQWVTLPLAIHGVVVLKSGKIIDMVIGEDDNDPVVGISDLLVHLSADQMDKKASLVIEGEDLNVTAGSIPLKGEKKDAVKANILKLLKTKYKMEEEDFVSAELEVVPAGKARDYGLDRSMVMGYGHDDRICAYTSMIAQFAIKNVKRTAITLLVDKEEVGSIGATGMHSRFFENAFAEIINLIQPYNEITLKRALQNSKMLSSDVSAAYDPNYASVNEEKNCAFMGRGLVFNKYTGSRGKGGCNDANAEYMAALRNIMDTDKVAYQTSELGKVDQGGGGTIAYILAQYGMEVIDCGIALHNMHAPWEIASKVDIYEATNGYTTFLNKA